MLKFEAVYNYDMTTLRCSLGLQNYVTNPDVNDINVC